MAICLISSQLMLSFLLIEIKSSPKNILSTPSIERIFLNKIFPVSFLFEYSTDPIAETFLPGMNFKEFGFGVF